MCDLTLWDTYWRGMSISSRVVRYGAFLFLAVYYIFFFHVWNMLVDHIQKWVVTLVSLRGLMIDYGASSNRIGKEWSRVLSLVHVIMFLLLFLLLIILLLLILLMEVSIRLILLCLSIETYRHKVETVFYKVKGGLPDF